MRRREFIALGSAACASCYSLRRAQSQQRMFRIGYLQIAAREAQTHLIRSFEDGLTDLGWRVGETISIECRFANGRPERLDALAHDLVDLRVDAIVTGVNLNTAA